MLRMLASVEAVKPLISALAACPHKACLFPHRDFRIILPLGGKTQGWEKSSNSLVENALGESSSFDGKWTATLSISPSESCMPVTGVLPLFLFYLLNPLIFPFMPKDVAHEKSCAGISACTADECFASSPWRDCFVFFWNMCYLKTLFYENYLIKEKHS